MAREVSSDFLRIDLTDGKTRKVISACQSDTIQRTLHFLVVNAGKPLDLTNLFYAEIIVKRTDGTYLDNACVIDGNDIQYTLKSTDVAVIGENEAHLLLSFKDGTVKETPTFYLNVFSTFYNAAAIQSQSEYTALVNKVLDAQEAANNALKSKNAAEAAAADAADSADEAGTYVETVSLYTSEAGSHASTAEFYASEAGSYLASASNVVSEVEAVSEYMSTTSEYLESASEYASVASSEAVLASTNAAAVSSMYTETSEYAQDVASEASIASSCADAAEAAAERAEQAQPLSLGETSTTAYRGDYGKETKDALGTASEASEVTGTTAFAKIQNLFSAFSDALTALKNTAIAKAVGATGSTFTAVINTLATIKDSRNRNKVATLTSSDGRRVHPYLGSWRVTNSDGTIRTCLSIPETGYYDTNDIIGATDAQIRALGWRMENVNSGVAYFKQNTGGNYDLGEANSYRYVNVDVGAAYVANTINPTYDAVVTTETGGSAAYAYSHLWLGAPTVSRSGSRLTISQSYTLRAQGWGNVIKDKAGYITYNIDLGNY